MDMKTPAAAASRAGVTNFSMMPLCQCFARRVNFYFDFYEFPDAVFAQWPIPGKQTSNHRTNDRDEKARGQFLGAG